MNKYVKYFIIGTGLIIVSAVIIFVVMASVIILGGIADGSLI